MPATADHYSTAKKARETGLFAVLSKDLPGFAFGAIDVAGPDARGFLHSQLTNEVKALGAGQGNFSARVTRTGTLVRYFSLHQLPVSEQSVLKGEHFLLLLERDGIPSLSADLGKYSVVEDVALDDVSD